MRNQSRRAVRRISLVVLVLFACFAGAAPAHANTYLFSFTTAQVLSALQTAVGSVPSEGPYNEDGFFAVWFQPSGFATSGGDNTVVSNPDSTTDPWATNANFTDPSDPNYGPGDWIQFSKQTNQLDISLITGNSTLFVPAGCTDTTTTNCHQYSDNGVQPVAFGSFNSLNGGSYLTNIIGNAATWSFEVETNSILNGSYTIQGIASGIHTGATTWPAGNSGVTTITDITFSMTASPTLAANPEPGTWMSVVVGLGLIVGGSVWKKLSRR